MSGDSRDMKTLPRVAFVVSMLMAASCSGGGSSRTAPSAPPVPTRSLPVVQVSIQPSPVRAVQLRVVDGTVTYRVSGTIVFTEVAGTGGQLTLMRGTIVRTPGGSAGGSLTTNVSIPARGTASFALSQDFDVSDAVDVAWQVAASGVDELGRAFETQIAQATVLPPLREPVYTSPSRLELWGGLSYGQYLGCLTCNEFHTESVFNQFGRYGSQFSSTSIWNPFSQYGSRFSAYSPCNEFGTSPPRVIDVTRNLFVGELTLNQFRTNAWRDPVVVTWLRTQVCS